jgi:hypothetical protein
MELQVSRAAPDPLALLVQLAQSDLLEDPERMVSPEDLALKAKLELQVAPVVLAEMDTPAHLARSLVHLVRQVTSHNFLHGKYHSS